MAAVPALVRAEWPAGLRVVLTVPALEAAWTVVAVAAPAVAARAVAEVVREALPVPAPVASREEGLPPAAGLVVVVQIAANCRPD
jgi:hypothetical protein